MMYERIGFFFKRDIYMLNYGKSIFYYLSCIEIFCVYMFLIIK